MSTKSRSLSIISAQKWNRKNCPLYGVVGGPLLSIQVNGRTVGILELSDILWVSAVEGCPLSGVPLQLFVS